MAFNAKHWDSRFAYKMDRFRNRLASKPSPIEKKVKKYLKELDQDFCFQEIIGSFIVDFLHPEWKLIIECDGYDFHSTTKQRNKDASRDYQLRQQGYKILRLLGWQCQIPAVCKGLITDFLTQAGVLTPRANGPVLSETSIADKTAKTETIKLAQTL